MARACLIVTATFLALTCGALAAQPPKSGDGRKLTFGTPQQLEKGRIPLATSPDGKTLLASDGKNQLAVWTLKDKDGKNDPGEEYVLPLDVSLILGARFTPDGEKVLV